MNSIMVKKNPLSYLDSLFTVLLVRQILADVLEVGLFALLVDLESAGALDDQFAVFFMSRVAGAEI